MSLKRRGRAARRHLHQTVIFELLGNSWQIMQVSNLLKTKFCLIEKGLLHNDMPGEIIECRRLD